MNHYIHVIKDGKEAKYWLRGGSCYLADINGFKPKELNFIEQTIRNNYLKIETAWNEHCHDFRK